MRAIASHALGARARCVRAHASREDAFGDRRRDATSSAHSNDTKKRRARDDARRATTAPTEVLSPYVVLNVPRDATTTELKIAFRKMAKATHPDSSGDADASGTAFRRAHAAYEVLTDDVRRSMIDDGIVDTCHGFSFVEGEIRTSLDYAKRSGAPLKKSTAAARERRRRRKKTKVKASAWEEKVMFSPKNRDELVKKWHLERWNRGWRMWCQAWFALLTFGAPVGVAYALAFAHQFAIAPH